MPANQGYLVVTSDCSSDETDVVPEIIVSEDGSEITVNVGNSEAFVDMGYLKITTKYEAFWSYISGFCGSLGYLYGSSSTAANLLASESPAASPAPSAAGSESENVTIITEGLDPTEAPVDLEDYSSCGFNCCQNGDCRKGCCVEGICVDKVNTFDSCANPIIKPAEGAQCGLEAWRAFKGDGLCPDAPIEVDSVSTSSLEATVAAVEVTNSTEAGTNATTVAGTGSTTSSFFNTVSAFATTPSSNGTDAAVETEALTESSVPTTVNTPIPSTPSPVATDSNTSSSPATSVVASEPTTTNSSEANTIADIQDDTPCVQGKCLNFDGICQREVVCMTPPCEKIDCAADEECVANLCGGCNAVCVGGSSTGGEVTEAPVGSPANVPKPAVEESPPSSPSGGDSPNNPPVSLSLCCERLLYAC